MSSCISGGTLIVENESTLDFPGLTPGKPSEAVVDSKGLTSEEIDTLLSSAARAATSDYLVSVYNVDTL